MRGQESVMKWILAGLCFALLMALAVATVAIRTTNVSIRARLQKAAEELEGRRVSHERVLARYRAVSGPAQLRRNWAIIVERTRQ